MKRSLAEELRLSWRFLRDLPGYFGTPPEPAEAAVRLAEARKNRETAFVQLLRQGLHDNPGSPYRRLLSAAGATIEDVEAKVRQDGIEAALHQLHAEGVYVTLEEFKGRSALRRGSLEIPAGELNFDNPGLTGHLRLQTGGSGGRPSRLVVDLGLLQQDALAHSVSLDEWQLRRAPLVLWRPLPPGAAGVKRYLMHARLGLCPEAWFAQEVPGSLAGRLKSRAFVVAMVLAARRLTGLRMPFPRRTPVSEAGRIATRLAGLRQHGFHCDTNVSSGLRIVRAAAAQGNDLSGGFFRVGGEPLTEARRQVFLDAGCRVGCNYAMAEIGAAGLGCCQGEAVDEVHLREDKVAVIRKPAVSGGQQVPGAFFLTSIHPLAPKVMINVCVGDFGRIYRRDCGCVLDRLGFHTRLSDILSFEKLTTEGMHFLGGDLVRLLDEALPRRFGGGPDHYQLAELDTPEGVRVELRIHPIVGPIDPIECREAVLEHLAAAAPENRLMVERWRQSDLLAIVRTVPVATGIGKVLTLRREKPTWSSD